MARLDYLNSPHSPPRSALHPGEVCYLAKIRYPSLMVQFHHTALACEATKMYFLVGYQETSYDLPCLPLDRSRIIFCDRQSCASSCPVAGSQYLECTVQSSDGPRKVCAHRKRRDRPRSRAHHLTRRRDPIRPAGERRDVWRRISRQRESAGRSAEPHRSAATEAVHQSGQAGYVVHRCYLQLYGWLG